MEVYGNENLIPNMHMHLHLKDCCLDYGLVYGFWCFAYECYNSILGTYQTNDETVFKPGALRPACTCLPDIAWLRAVCVCVCVHPRGYE